MTSRTKIDRPKSVTTEVECRDVGLLQYTHDVMSAFGKYSLEDRAIADYRDGLKPVQRRILWAMHKLGLHHKAGMLKAARVVGDCFTKGTSISTPFGSISIENLKVGDTVTTSRGVYPVVGLIANKNQPMYELALNDDKVVITTKNQEVKVKVGDKFFWKKVCDLTPNDDIVIEA